MVLTTVDSTRPANDTNSAHKAAQERMLSRATVPVILALMLLIPAGRVVWRFATGAFTIDFFTSWTISRAVSTGHIAHIYSPESQREMGLLAINEASLPTASASQRRATEIVTQHYNGRIDAPGTPFIYAAIGAVSSGNYTADQKRFVSLCTICLVLSMLILKNVLRFSWLEFSLLVLFVATDYMPVLSDMGVGNVNEIQLLAIVLFIFFTARNQPLLSGLAIGAATMFKPITALVLLLALVAGVADREYRQLARMLLGCSIGTLTSFLLSVAFFGTPTIWVEFVRSLSQTLNGVSYPLQFGNFSLSALLFGTTRAGSSAIPLLLVGAFSWLLFATRVTPDQAAERSDELTARRTHTALAVGGGGCAIMLLSSPLVWLHYYLLLLPLSLYVIHSVSGDASNVFAGKVGMRSVAALVLPFALFFVFSSATEMIVGVNAWLTCVLIVAATLATLALASYRIWQGRAL
jgi:Glycosyltransferase family 87